MNLPRRSPKRLALLGATGSVGEQVCDLVARHPDRFVLHALVAGRDGERLSRLAAAHPQAHAFLAQHPDADPDEAARQVDDAITDPEVDLVVVAVAGSAALRPTLAALAAGKDVALATKEVLVMAGDLVRQGLERGHARVLPIDSEHSAIWQCLRGEPRSSVRRLILTGSGGPFLRRPRESLRSVTVAEALQHPRWTMGPKITVDSATMMNKGLEIIEAHFLFEIPYAGIDVLVHPESVVHSMVEFCDGSIKAQLGVPDMHLPIAVALSYPERLPGVVAAPDLAALGRLTFEPVDAEQFPAVGLARRAGESAGTTPAVLNAANEQAVAHFLNGELPFDQIVPTVAQVVARAPRAAEVDLGAIAAADRWARDAVREMARPELRPAHSKLPA